MTRGAGPTFWSVFIQLDLRNIFENILVQKNLKIFKFFDENFFLRFFWNFKIFKIRKCSKFQVRKNLCTHPEVRNLDGPGISVAYWNVPDRF